MKHKIFLLLALLVIAPFAIAQEPMGIFDDHQDIGEPGIPGMVEYDSGSGQYLVDAVGATISNRSINDEFHFAFKEMSGSFAIETSPWPLDDMGRGGLMIRQSLDQDSVHISLLMSSGPDSDGNSDLGSVFPTFRTLKGGGSIRDGDPYDQPGGLTDEHTGPIRLERIGNSIHFYTKNTAGEWLWLQSESAAFEDNVLAGLAATTENTNEIAYFEFKDVQIIELPLNIMRDLPTDSLEKGATLTDITLTAKSRSQVAIATINEILPLSARASNVQSSAGEATLTADGAIDWVLTDFDGEATLTYDVILGQHSSAAWRGTFNDGENRDSFIGGEALLPKAPQFTPLEQPLVIDPVFPTIVQVEQGFWLNAETDFGLMLDLKSSGGVSVVAMTSSAQSILEIPISIQESGTYYVFGRVRSEDGNSDSFHFNIDDYPAGDNSSNWSVSMKKNFANEWVSSSDPATDPRSFQLDAGDHFIYLANREDSASIDWLCITSNPNLGIATFDEETEFFITRDLDDTEYQAGKTYNVTISRPASGSFSSEMTVSDTPPAGWPISNLNASGGAAAINDQGQIAWSLTGVAGSQTLTYSVTAPDDDIKGGSFEGTYSYIEPIPLPGDNVISKSFSFQNVNVDSPVPVQLVNGEAMIEAENAYLYTSDETSLPFSIRFAPDASQELYAYAERGGGSSITMDELNFVFEITEPGIYRVIARTRTPNGTDDSFYVGMDNDIQTTTIGYRFEGYIELDELEVRIYDDEFHAGWLGVDGNMDLSWDITAGVHTFRIHIREDGSMVDWVMLTNNLDQNPSDLEPVTAIDDFMLY